MAAQAKYVTVTDDTFQEEVLNSDVPCSWILGHVVWPCCTIAR